MRNKFTALEKSWILYDVGNSAFILLVSTFIPIYFNYLADNANISSVNYLSYFGYATSISTLIVAILGPILGSISDLNNIKKRLFLFTFLIGMIGCILLGVSTYWIVFLIIFILAKVGYSSSIIFYDSMLTDITTKNNMDYVSSNGFAWGYIGSCIPFCLCLLLMLNYNKLNLSLSTAMLIIFFITAFWWLLCTLPLLKNYDKKPQNYNTNRSNKIINPFPNLLTTLKEIKGNKKILLFLLSFFFYIDGVYTIISMSTAYGKALGLSSTGLLLALLVTQVIAFPCSIFFGKLSKKHSSKSLISLCITGYLGIAFFALFISNIIHFWILAICVGMFQGGIQALSRSHYAKIIPANQSGEYFGILDICGKGASFLGTTIIGITSQLTGNVNLGIGSLIILFLIGLILFRVSTIQTITTSNAIEGSN